MSSGDSPNIASKTILVVANETLGGKELLDAVRERADSDTRFILCVPQNKPASGLVIYADAMFDAAQVRLDLALEVIRSMDIRAIGEVGDPDPFSATLDAVREYSPREIIISTYPETRSGWLRRDLIERVREGTGLPVTHIVNDIDSEGLPFHVTLAVANRTASGDELLHALQAKAEAFTHAENRQLFIVVVPAEGGQGVAVQRARTRLKLVLDRLHVRGLYAAGMVGDPDPFTAISNALQNFRVDDIVISTFAETKSGWLRSDLIERVRRASGKEVEHVVHEDVPTPTT
ncbi:MAG TPA: hypothetical protein VFH80_16025 [Solirubrobacteraceae bacterium]|nr:hypothetical protein [Solirubrobacteraceae bacterium]